MRSRSITSTSTSTALRAEHEHDKRPMHFLPPSIHVFARRLKSYKPSTSLVDATIIGLGHVEETPERQSLMISHLQSWWFMAD